jgi:hypothetical protein
MTALSTLRFSGYTLRPAGEADRRLAEQWTARDEDHAGKIDPGFWLEQQPGIDSVVVEDSQGPVFFFKTCLLIEKIPGRAPLPVQLVGLSQATLDEVRPLSERIAAEVFIQFMPCTTDEDRERTRQALIEGTAWLAPVLEQSGAEEMFFDSRQPKLIAFCQKRLGFIVDGKDLGDGYMRLRRALQPGKRSEKMEGV